MEMIGLTLQTIGELFIGFVVLFVHHRVLSERKIDLRVFKSIQLEQILGVIGILLIIAGYVIRVLA